MCRFVVYRGDPVDLRSVMFGGSHPLVEQAWDPRELLVGHTNADGYGIVWYEGGRPIRIARREPAWYDPDLEGLLEVLSGETVVASLRNATAGMSLGSGGLAPLVREGWTFVLNGYVTAFHQGLKRRVHGRLSDRLYRHLLDGSDTEALLLLALQVMDEDGVGPAEALVEVVAYVRGFLSGMQDPGTAQLNMVLTDGDRAAVCRASSEEATNSLYRATGSALFPGGTMVASEALDGDDRWIRVEPQTVLEVAPDGRVRSVPVPL